MRNDRFEIPVSVRLGPGGEPKLLRSAHEASEFLLHDWPGKRTPKQRAAIQACYDAESGNKPAMTARRALIAAAREADILVSDKTHH